MMSMFSDVDADFSLILPDDTLFVGKVLQKTVLDVNEEGSEGAAATVIEIKDISPEPGFSNPHSTSGRMLL